MEVQPSVHATWALEAPPARDGVQDDGVQTGDPSTQCKCPGQGSRHPAGRTTGNQTHATFFKEGASRPIFDIAPWRLLHAHSVHNMCTLYDIYAQRGRIILR